MAVTLGRKHEQQDRSHLTLHAKSKQTLDEAWGTYFEDVGCAHNTGVYQGGTEFRYETEGVYLM